MPWTFFDSLYGEVSLPAGLETLVVLPPVQRLRHIRLSNIDSLDMPGISGVSRYEHSLGVAFLISKLGIFKKLSSDDQLLLGAAGLLHDWTIAPYGHLVEEAMEYAGTDYNHEQKHGEFTSVLDNKDIGGSEQQIFLNKETGLRNWLYRAFGSSWEEKENKLAALINGNGQFGQIIKSAIDLDNADNLVRIAFHMGLQCDRNLPIHIAESVIYVNSDSSLIFREIGKTYVAEWVELRKKVYTKLMLSRRDFAGKSMLLSATVGALDERLIDEFDWKLTDAQLIDKLLASKKPEHSATTSRWMLGDVWELTGLYWFNGHAPTLKDMNIFSKKITSLLGRTCFAYRIKDKRSRLVTVIFENSGAIDFGGNTNLWVVGVASSDRDPFTQIQTDIILRTLEKDFNSKLLGPALQDTARQVSLF